MDAKAAIRSNFNLSDMVFKSYISDLSDAELMKRPVEGCNHVAYQVGHVIASEVQLLAGITGTTTPLPDGFADQYAKENASSDDAASFLSGKEYVEIYDSVRAASVAALAALPESELDADSPENLRSFAPTKGDVFNLIASHPMMHAGQFVAVRRQTGKPIVM